MCGQVPLSMAFWHQFGGCTLTYGDLCWPAGLEATRLTYEYFGRTKAAGGRLF